MRRDIAALLATTAAVAVIMVGAFLLPAAERAFRHADAKAAQPELPSPAALLSGYSTVFSSVLSGQYSNASDMISYLNSSYVPESVRYVFGRFNSLFSSAVSDMNKTEILVVGAREAVGVGMVSEARALAGNASVVLWRANSTASLLRDSSETLASKLKVPQLRTGISSIDARIAYLAQELSEVRSEISRIEAGELAGAQITIALDRSEAWVGSLVTASGILAGEDGSPIVGAAVFVGVEVEGAAAAYSATTGGDGRYSLTFPAPFLYGESAAVHAYFPASGEYAGCRSADISLRLLWLQPDLEASLNATRAKSGDWVLVSGRTGIGGSHGEMVSVSAFGSNFTACPSGGAFSLAVQIPASAPSGRNAIRVSVVPSGIVGPDSSTVSLEVYRLPTAVTLSLPMASVSGSTVRVKGMVFSASDWEPMPGASVTVRSSGGTYEAVSAEDGTFEVDLPMGLAVPTGWVSVSATAYPAAACYQQSSTSSGFYAVNPSILAVPAAALALAYGAFGRSRGARAGKPRGLSWVRVEAGADRKVRAGAMSAVVSAYHRAAAAVGGLVGAALGRSETLREFLRRASCKSGGAVSEPFAELTRMAEEELYAGRAQEAARAESLLQRLLSLISAIRERIPGATGTAGKAKGSADGNAGGGGAGSGDMGA